MSKLVLQTAPAPGGDPFFPIVMLVVVFIFMYFLSIRPHNQRMKRHRQMVTEIKKGDVVITNGGLIGKVKKASEEELTLDLGSTEVKVMRTMIAEMRPTSNSGSDKAKADKAKADKAKADKAKADKAKAVKAKAVKAKAVKAKAVKAKAVKAKAVKAASKS